MDEADKQEMVRRLRLSRQTESPEVLQLWRDHGTEWAREEASYSDISFIASIAQATSKLSDEEAAEDAVSELKKAWREGWAKPLEPYGWNEMNDHLPPSAYLAFVQGVELAWNDVKDRV